jgi:hypothetical protein
VFNMAYSPRFVTLTTDVILLSHGPWCVHCTEWVKWASDMLIRHLRQVFVGQADNYGSSSRRGDQERCCCDGS